MMNLYISFVYLGMVGKNIKDGRFGRARIPNRLENYQVSGVRS